MKSTEYKNPPVFEVGMTFHFQPSGDTPEWNDVVALEYVKKYQSRFPTTEFVVQQEFRIETNIKEKTQRAGVTSPKFSEVYARSEDQSEVLGIGLNYFTYHKIRLGQSFPHFRPVAQSAFDFLPEYIDFWKPEKIKQISLLYLDVIEIPSQQFDLDEYFHLGLKVPKEFGAITDFENRFTFPGKQAHMQLDIVFQRVPARNLNESVTQFCIHWNCRKSEINTLDTAKIRDEMDGLHEYVRECFEASFTDKCKELFVPVLEGEQS